MPNPDTQNKDGDDHRNVSSRICDEPNGVRGDARLPAVSLGGVEGDLPASGYGVDGREPGGWSRDEILAELEEKLRRELRFSKLPVEQAVEWIFQMAQKPNLS